MDEATWRQATRELLRALRAHRSQVAFARWLGFRSNVPAAWEGGHRCPDAVELFRVCGRVRVDAGEALRRFHAPAADAVSTEEVGSWLQELRGRTSIADLSERSGCSTTQLRRWLGGRARPKVFQFLMVVDALTGRAPDLVAELVDIEQVSTLTARYRAGRTQRRLAFEYPWTAAVRVLVEATRPPVEDAATRLAMALHQPVEPIAEALDLLLAHGLLTATGGRLVATGHMTVDMRATPEDRRRFRAHWAHAAANRVEADVGDLMGFSLLAVSRDDLDRIRQLQRRYFREMRSIVAASQPVEVAALVVAQVAAFPDPGAITLPAEVSEE